MKQRKNHPTAINARKSIAKTSITSNFNQKNSNITSKKKAKSQALNTALNSSIIIAGLTFALNPISQQVAPYNQLAQSVLSSFTSGVFVEAQGYLPPIANPDTRSTDPLTPITIQIDANDVPNALSELDPTSIVIVEQPTQGTVDVNLDGSVLYTPNITIDRNTVDTFTYTIEDNGNLISNSTTVTINIIVPTEPLPEPEPTPQPQPEVTVVPQSPVINQQPTLSVPVPKLQLLPTKSPLTQQDTIRSGGEMSNIGYVFSLTVLGLFVISSIAISLRNEN